MMLEKGNFWLGEGREGEGEGEGVILRKTPRHSRPGGLGSYSYCHRPHWWEPKGTWAPLQIIHSSLVS